MRSLVVLVFLHIINNEHTMIKNSNIQDYVAPQLQVVFAEVEEGFALSNLENIGGENEDIDW